MDFQSVVLLIIIAVAVAALLRFTQKRNKVETSVFLREHLSAEHPYTALETIEKLREASDPGARNPLEILSELRGTEQPRETGYREQRDELLSTLKEALAILETSDDVTDTIWYSSHETLCDYIKSAIAKAGASNDESAAA